VVIVFLIVGFLLLRSVDEDAGIAASQS